MGVNKKGRVKKSLTTGRPPTVLKPKSISRKATRTLINSHHVLEKKKAQAIAKGDIAAQAAIEAEIAALGGLEKYQQASLQGQRLDRGGDSSRVLMEWLKTMSPGLSDVASPSSVSSSTRGAGLRMLEVGALSTANACSKSGIFGMERIDLNSQSDGILQQDFMKRPLPKDDSERFDIISLSLVLNFVPDAIGRGEMLLRTLEFLKEPDTHYSSQLRDIFPSLFMVLPAPCITNSRYMNEAHIDSIMNTLGYMKVQSKTTQKLVYYLWVRKSAVQSPLPAFKKLELRSGHSRNNFAIVIRGSSG
ncbi:putative methyltransferase-domain-containing protein [Daldinia caldariorum]|uniref:putative methyltransferase-domain-containing protein n=1 Tax=Daldinia caldariorum TaxID=326644 RepID=UPI0020085CD5|nr:putative methyltransferase-domain-containing protein [Daldinia caldariorum]KAI1464791.1 putative methyltransferase-domain-containing protein [Daldinia caldariorum]